MRNSISKTVTTSLQCLGLLASLGGFVQSASAEQAAPTGDATRGKYVAILGDCGACHTAPKGGQTYAGGYPLATPFGTIYSANVTPSKSSGIGNYSFEQFDRAMRKGVRADGVHLYPAMPYTSYEAMTDQDMADLYAFIMQEIKTVDVKPPQTELPFPFDMRFAIGAWNMLYLPDKRFVADASQSDEWNRGAYLAQTLAHCSVCHTPRGLMANEIKSEALGGGSLGSWYAPNITADEISGINDWSVDELATYLKTGRNAHAQAAAGMAEAVTNSFQHTTDADLKAMAVYIKTVPAVRNADDTKPRDSYGKPFSNEVVMRGAPASTADDAKMHGAILFSGYCASCHQPSAAGVPDKFYPALFGNSVTGASRPDNFVSAVLYGVNRPVGDQVHFMPAFGKGSYVQVLTDRELVDLTNYVFATYGNPAVKVTTQDIETLKKGGKPPPLVILGRLAKPGLIGAGLLLILLISWRMRRKSQAKVA